MTKDAYLRMTAFTRRTLSRLPGGTVWLRAPTLACAVSYMAALLHLMLRRDTRLVRALLVPAACFIACTALRPLIGRQRPYDRFGAPPVGAYAPGKGKSMPSRHTASAAAIALALAYVFPHPAVGLAACALCLLIAALRVLSGQHYPGDVLAALALSAAISAVGYAI